MTTGVRVFSGLVAGLVLTSCAQAEPAAAPPYIETALRKKRGPAPPLPAAVVAAGVAYAAVVDGTARGLDQPTGYIAATDAASERQLWTLKVFATRTDPAMEADKQDLHIARLAFTDGRRALLVTDERGGRYRVDLATRTVKRLP